MNQLTEQIRNLTSDTGVYLFKDETGTILYVGKAVDLHRRVSSYLKDPSSKSVRIRQRAASVEVYVTGSEVEALILEHNLIKKHKPPLNIELKDDKTYPYIELTVDDPYPGIYFSRKTGKKGCVYFGPYPSAGAVRRIISMAEKFFRLRTCRADFDRRKRPCLKYQVQRCTAPCVGLVDADQYREQVTHARMFLEGRYDALEKQIRLDMERLAETLAFEQAAELRDLLKEVERFRSQRIVLVKEQEPVDVVARIDAGDRVFVVVLHFRNGRLLDKSEYAFEPEDGNLQPFLEQYLYRRRGPLGKLLVNELPENPDLLAAYHLRRFDRKLAIHRPERGRLRKVMGMAMENARQMVLREEKAISELNRLSEDLGLSRVPRVVECLDISHLAGTDMVGAVVRFTDGNPDKRQYRRFQIKHGQGNDDFLSMKEVMTRRYGRLKREGRPFPDLVVIDGGKGQLSVAKQVVAELGLQGEFDLVALAKKDERVFSADLPDGLVLDFHQSAHRLLPRIRDEAHRFAIEYNRQKRSASASTPGLRDVPGIGEQKVRRLMRRFGSLPAVLGASDDQLAEVIGPSDIAAIRAWAVNSSLASE